MSPDTWRPRLARLWQTLLAPLWIETEELTARRRCHLLLALPIVAVAGAAWGALVAGDLAMGTPTATLFGAITFTFLLHLQLRLQPLLSHFWGRERGTGPLAAFLWDLGLGGGLAWLLTERLGAPWAPAVGIATASGALYALVTGYFLCGSGVSDLVDAFLGTRGRSTPHRNEHSRAASLAARGEVEAAVFEYRMAIEADASDPVPYLRCARLVASRPGRAEEALAILREGVLAARTNPEEDALLVRRIVELCEKRLGDPTRAAPDLARLAERRAGTDAASWAGAELSRVKGELSRRLATSGRGPGDAPEGDLQREERRVLD